MIFLVLLSIIVDGEKIFPNKPYQLKEVEWIECEYPHEPYQLVSSNTTQYYEINDKSMCQKNIEYEIPLNYYDQLYYHFVFAKPIENELNISIDGFQYNVSIEQLNNTREIVILHTHEYFEGKQYPICIKGKNNYFQQFYIFNYSNETPTKDRILYHTIVHPIPKIDEIPSLNLQSSILEQKYIFARFNFQFKKSEQLFACHFKIPEQELISLKLYNDTIVQLESQFQIEEKHKITHFILRAQTSVEIRQIFGGNDSVFESKFDLIIQTDGQNNVIQTFVNESNYKLHLFSEIQIHNFPNSTLIIELKPSGITCPSDLNITLTHLEISSKKNSNYVQWYQFQQSNFSNCKIYINHSITNEGDYQVKLIAKMTLDNLTFYLENQGVFSIYYVPQIEYNLRIVIGVYFGTIIILLGIFIVFLKKCGMIIFSQLDTIYYKTIFEENQIQE